MKHRLDKFLLECGFTTQRAKAKQLINSKRVYVDSKLLTDPSKLVDANCNIEIREVTTFAGRGAIKLAGA